MSLNQKSCGGAGEPIDKPLYIHRQTCYLFGRERRVADVPLDHPSISKQHAVMQYRWAPCDNLIELKYSYNTATK